MTTLQIDNLPEDLYQSIQKHAIAASVSLNDAVIQILAKGISDNPINAPMSVQTEQMRQTREALDKIRSFPRKNPADFGLPDSTEMVREDRDR